MSRLLTVIFLLFVSYVYSNYSEQVFELKELSFTSSGEFIEISSPGLVKKIGKGTPNLPVFSKIIEIGENFKYELEVIETEKMVLSRKIAPAQESVMKSALTHKFYFDSKSYLKDEFLGDDLLTVEKLGKMGDKYLARLQVAPFAYNPVTNELQITKKVIIRISYDSFFMYFKSLEETYVIISDRKFEKDLESFVDLKKQNYNVIVAYTDEIGRTPESIKSFLSQTYSKYEQKFVLLVGDVAEVPAFKGKSGSHVTDLYYCEYTGDYLPESYCGRFSASNSKDLLAQLNKSIQYETKSMEDPSYLSRALLIAGADSGFAPVWGNGQITYGANNYFNSNYGISARVLLYPDATRGTYSKIIKEEINRGVGYANYTAHCSPAGWADPSFVSSDIAGITNYGKFGVWVGNCCQSNKFEQNAFSEVAMRAENRGSVAYIGGTNNTYWDEDYWWAVGFKKIIVNPSYDANHLGAYDTLFSRPTTLGEFLVSGNLAVEESTSPRKLYYWEIYNLMGDPSLEIKFL